MLPRILATMSTAVPTTSNADARTSTKVPVTSTEIPTTSSKEVPTKARATDASATANQTKGYSSEDRTSKREVNASTTRTNEVATTKNSEVPATRNSKVPATRNSKVPTNASEVPTTGAYEVPTTKTSEVPATRNSEVPTRTSAVPTTRTNEIPRSTTMNTPMTSRQVESTTMTSEVQNFTFPENVTLAMTMSTSILPTIAPNVERYPVSSDYYWPNLNVNTTPTALKPVPIVPGPFGFGNAIKLSALNKNCVRRSQFYDDIDENLQCFRNPGNCSSGLSVSIWENIVFDAAEVNSSKASYIFSTGGDTEGMPGIALYHKGVDMHAVVSNGSHYWHLNVMGPVPNNTWSNIGLRWKDTVGLEMFVDKERVGMMIFPETTSQPKKAIEPPEVVVGCHVVTNEPRYINFSSGRYDELAIWMHRLNDTEVNHFLGGYDSVGATMTVDDLKSIIASRLNLSDPEQNMLAVELLSKMTADVVADDNNDEQTAAEPQPEDGINTMQPSKNDTDSNRKRRSIENEPTKNITTTTTMTSTAAPTQDPSVENFRKAVEKLRTVSDIVTLMTDPSKIKRNMTKEEMITFQDLLIVISNMFCKKRKTDWEAIQKEKAGSSAVVDGLQNWTMALLQEARPRVNSQRSTSFMSEKFTDNIVLNTKKITIQEYVDGKGLTIPDYRSSGWDKVPWSEGTPRIPLDSVRLGRELFSDLNRPKSSSIFVTCFLFDTYDDIAPRNVNTKNLPSKNIFIDSKVISLAIEPIDGLDYNFYLRPAVVTLAHNKKEGALRRLLFHDESRTIPTVKYRYCAMWNSEVHPFGGWDSSRCDLYFSNDDYSICHCDYMGTYAIIAQNIERRAIHDDPEWLLYMKYVTYGFSAFFLVFYMLMILLSRQLKDQFHIIRFNTAFATLAGTACMFTTDYVRGERHECTAVTAVLHYAYVAVACCLVSEAHALLSAIIYGVIAGKLKSYIPFSWGCPMIFLGIAFVTGFQDYGFEPRCLVSWDDRLKWALFAPNLILSFVAILLTSATLINVSFAAVKKEIIFEDVSSVAWGLLFVGITFLTTWIFACMAYLDIEFMYPDFYPIFQVLNAGLGTMEFLFMGVGSKRFRIVLRGETVDSRHFPLVNQKIKNLVPVKPQPKHKGGPLQG